MKQELPGQGSDLRPKLDRGIYLAPTLSSPGRTRTYNPLVNSEVLHYRATGEGRFGAGPLSYRGMFFILQQIQDF